MLLDLFLSLLWASESLLNANVWEPCGVGTYQEVVDFIQLLGSGEVAVRQVTNCFIQHEYLL